MRVADEVDGLSIDHPLPGQPLFGGAGLAGRVRQEQVLAAPAAAALARCGFGRLRLLALLGLRITVGLGTMNFDPEFGTIR